jgi:sulfate adenylyltransferase subunit 1 (EFTu-like GTPase family)
MATGASNAQLAVILIDARKGVLTQTRRHSFICSLLGVRHVVIAVNKIDLVNYQHDVFSRTSATTSPSPPSLASPRSCRSRSRPAMAIT